jgi:hypothetical protein
MNGGNVASGLVHSRTRGYLNDNNMYEKLSPYQLDETLIELAAQGLLAAERRGIRDATADEALAAAMEVFESRDVMRLLLNGLNPDAFKSTEEGAAVIENWAERTAEKVDRLRIDQQG